MDTCSVSPLMEHSMANHPLDQYFFNVTQRKKVGPGKSNRQSGKFSSELMVVKEDSCDIPPKLEEVKLSTTPISPDKRDLSVSSPDSLYGTPFTATPFCGRKSNMSDYFTPISVSSIYESKEVPSNDEGSYVKDTSVRNLVDSFAVSEGLSYAETTVEVAASIGRKSCCIEEKGVLKLVELFSNGEATDKFASTSNKRKSCTIEENGVLKLVEVFSKNADDRLPSFLPLCGSSALHASDYLSTIDDSNILYSSMDCKSLTKPTSNSQDSLIQNSENVDSPEG